MRPATTRRTEQYPNDGFKLSGWLFAMAVLLITASWLVLRLLGLGIS